MPRTRVLVVDDSVVVRRLVCDELARDPDLHVIGSAASGAIALAKVDQLNPDVVTLDVEMDGMSGLETLARLRATHPHIRVIMFSAHTAKGAETTIDALLLGASDYVLKPSTVNGEVGSARDELVRKIKALTRRELELDAASGPPVLPALPRLPGHRGQVDVVAIGVSTGGPNALMELLPALPGAFPAAILIVQHMPPVFTRLLAEALTERCALRVEEAVEGALVAPGIAWLAPGDHHMKVVRQGTELRLTLSATEPPENSCRPAVDVLLRSVARAVGPAALAVIMTGMGRDGFVGAEHVKEAGGQVLAQDEATSIVWGMPGFVARAGLADAVVPLSGLAEELQRRVGLRCASGGA